MTEKKSLRVEDYIEHILGAVDRIESYIDGLDRASFEKSTVIQDAVIRNLEIIGEAANKIVTADPSFAQQNPQLRLELAYRMRNALIHGYDSVNLTTIWNTIQSDLPTLRHQLTNMRCA